MKILLSIFAVSCSFLATAQFIKPVSAIDIGNFIKEHLQYPKEALRKGIQGNVKVRFLIDEQGKIDSIKAITNYGFGLEPEAERVVALLPDWKSASNDGKPVKCYMTLPVTFDLGSRNLYRMDLSPEQNLLREIKINSKEKFINLLSDYTYDYPLSGRVGLYNSARLNKGIYKLVMSSLHGFFYMSDSLQFSFNGYPVGGLFQPFEDPQKLFVWYFSIRSKEKALKRIDPEWLKTISANPLFGRLHISFKHLIEENQFAVK